jgi:hypothetical protein
MPMTSVRDCAMVDLRVCWLMWRHQAARAWVSSPALHRGATYRAWKSLCLGVKRAEEKTMPPFRLGNCTAQQGEGTWQKDKRGGYTVRQDHPSRKWQT